MVEGRHELVEGVAQHFAVKYDTPVKWKHLKIYGCKYLDTTMDRHIKQTPGRVDVMIRFTVIPHICSYH
jgi:hypothetical protein